MEAASPYSCAFNFSQYKIHSFSGISMKSQKVRCPTLPWPKSIPVCEYATGDKRSLTWGGEHTVQHTDDVLQKCIPETYVILLTLVTPIHSIKIHCFYASLQGLMIQPWLLLKFSETFWNHPSHYSQLRCQALFFFVALSLNLTVTYFCIYLFSYSLSSL